MDKSKKLIVFYLSSFSCKEYSIQLISTLKEYNPLLYVNKNHKEIIPDATEFLKIPRNKLLLLLHSLAFYIRLYFILQKQLENDKTPLLYSLSFHPYNYILAKLAKRLKIEFVLTVHDYTTHIGEKSALVEWIQKKTINISSLAVFLSQNEANKARKDGINDEKIKVLKHPLYSNSNTHSLLHSNKLNLLFIGRLLDYKGLDIFNNLSSESYINQITIAGKGDFSSIDCDQSKINCIDKWLDIKEIEQLLMAHHLLVLPYKEASQSGVISQGFSYEIPMLISNLAGLREQISEHSALFFDGSLAHAKIVLKKLAASEELYNKLKSEMRTEKQEFILVWKSSMKSFIQELGIS